MANEKSKQIAEKPAKEEVETIQDAVTVVEEAVSQPEKARLQLKRCNGVLTGGWINAIHEEPRQPQDVLGMIHTVKTKTSEEVFYSFREEEFAKLAVLLGMSM